AQGERQHTIYLAATPEYGKATFYQRLTREVEHVRRLYPLARLTGGADGSEDNGTFLGQFTDDGCIDFHHATGYLGGVARAAHPRNFTARQEWLDSRCHRLKHDQGAARELLAEMTGLPREGLSEAAREELDKAITYFTNHHQQMSYAQRLR